MEFFVADQVLAAIHGCVRHESSDFLDSRFYFVKATSFDNSGICGSEFKVPSMLA